MEGVVIRHRTVKVNGISMHVAEAGPEVDAKGAVLFLHGFPELWYSWRHQMDHLGARGYRCIAPDLRGYGGTTAPPDVASYTAFHIVGDLVALLDTLGLAKEPGVAEKQFAPAHAKRLMRQMLCHCFSHGVFCDEEMDDHKYPTSPLPPWLTEADMDYFVTSFEKTGFTGAINYYRNFDKNCELAAPWADAKVQVPTKYIVGDGDITYNFEGIQEYIHGGGFKEDVPLLDEVVVIPGAGHFIQQERAQEVSDHIYDFIIKF
ncbi:hypothetical protein CFC21_050787 [Triticum aestivum]|uniref:AB hydrolase-1 domain-containing protein n=3 Tax=Triticinae TaxID=1648030 RepID=A0A3B6H7F6_WHEAT|nr:hypothetical protein CFC21_050787 [Triticum aestivum]